jgi:hypothetical protein
VMSFENLVTEGERDEVDDVSGRTDEAEFCELNPVAALAQPLSDAPRNAGGSGGIPLLRVTIWWAARVGASGRDDLPFVVGSTIGWRLSTLGGQPRA